MQAEPATRPQHARVFAAILALGTALRLWSIGDGAPFVAEPDEWRLVESALAIVRTNDWHPSFAAGPLAVSLQAVATTIRFLLGAVQGAWPTVEAVWPGEFLVSSRMLSAVCGVLTVAVVYRIGARWSPTTAAVAGLLAACSLALVSASQLATHDALLVLLVSTTWLAAIRAAESRRTMDTAIAGVVAGLTAAAAFSGVLAVLIAGAAVIVSGANARARQLAVLGGACLLAFLVASPHALIDLPGYLNAAAAALAERSARTRVDGLVPLAHALADHVALLPRPWDPTRVSGVLGLAFAAVGALYLVSDMLNVRRSAAVAGLFTLGAYGWAALAAGDATRATWPLVPALCLVMAVGVDTLLQRARHASSRTRRALVLAASLLVGCTSARTLDRDWRRHRDSPDERAALWLVTRLQPGDRVVIEGHRLRLPPGYASTAVSRLIDYAPAHRAASGTTYLAANAGVSDDFTREPQRYPAEATAYRALFSRLAIAASFAAHDSGESAVTILAEPPDRR